jgi:glutamate N-acetyltransferase/amino-acid N-acetyltransferase
MAGVAKGSGMIHPNMATMLAIITCDANISTETLQVALKTMVTVVWSNVSFTTHVLVVKSVVKIAFAK